MAAPLQTETKRCLYEVLGLPTDCSADDIRAAYKRLALQRHPDKLVQSGVSAAAATAAFQELLNAYQILSDARERAWYDSHRSQILFSDPSNSSNSPIPDLFSFFSNSAFSGYSASGSGFYRVYSDVFDRVYSNEVNFARKLGLGSVKEAPVMGNLDSPYSQVKAFYDYWLGFVTVMDFSWVDQYDAMAGVNRKSRRVMEDENRKLRKKARREFNETVRGLAEFAKKRDKRVIDMAVKRSADMERRKAEERERRREQERERAERARVYEEPEWSRIEEEIDNGIVEVEDDVDKRKKKEGEEFYCVACGKKFKSEKQWKNHEQSKKHKENVAELRESFRNEDGVEEEEENLDGDVDETRAEFNESAQMEDQVDVLNEQFENGFGIEEERFRGETSSSSEEQIDVCGIDNVKSVGGPFESDDEMSVLEAMVSGHKSRRKAASKHQPKFEATEVHAADVDSDHGDLMEYDNRKSTRRTKAGKREKGKKFSGETVRADDIDINGQSKENNAHDFSTMEDSSSHPVADNDIKDKGDQRLESDNQVPNRPVDRRGKERRETNAKSKNASKGHKHRPTPKNSGNMCDKCGEEFESRNKLHKHLSNTGHASLKSR